MISKKALFLLFSIILVQLTARAQSLYDLRMQYMDALHDCELAPKVYDAFSNIEEPTAKMLAYRGALEAIMTKTTWNVFKKISYLNKSEASFNEAVRKSPDDIEIRYMRMAVQFEIPEYLGYSDDMEADKIFIVNHIEEFNPAQFPDGIIDEIIGFMNKCNKFTHEQVEKFKGVLALN